MINSKKTKIRISKKALVISALLLALVLALSVFSYAWFRHTIAMNGADISTGKIAYRFTGYQEYNGPVIKKNFAYSTDPEDTETIFDFDSQAGYYPIEVDGEGDTDISKYPKSPVSGISHIVPNSEAPNVTTSKNGVFYYVIERLDDSVDLDLSLSFGAQIENLRVAGGFWYIIEAKPLENFDSANIENNFGTSASDIQKRESLSSIQNSENVTTLEGGLKYWCIKLTFGLQERAGSEDYTEQNIDLVPTLCVAQKGGLENKTEQAERPVTTLEAFERELANYSPNETIVVKGPIEYVGDLIINRPLNLRIESTTLTVRGDLRYNYTGVGSFKIDTATNGSLRVLEHESSHTGGNFDIEVPSSTFEIVGMGTNDIVVEGDLTVSTAYHIDGVDGNGNEMKYGLTIDKARIVHTNEALKAIKFKNMPSLLVNRYTNIGDIRVASNAPLYRIKIKNEGTIKRIDLAAMTAQNQTNSFTGLSILIENLNEITEPIALPTWSTPVTETITEGNTKILRHLSAKTMTVAENDVCAFKTEHIVVVTKEVLVEKDPDDPKKITLDYMKTKEQQENGEQTSIRDILTKYVNAEDETKIPALDQITHLTIVCNNETMDNDDYLFIRNNLKGLTYLDLYNAESDNGELPAGAFVGLSELKTITMPYSDTSWGGNLFSGTQIDEITVPVTVQTIASGAFTKTEGGYVKYIFVESDEVLTLGTNSLIFVPTTETIDKYLASNASLKGKVFVRSERFDTEYGTFFLKLTATGCEFVTWGELKPTWKEAFVSSVERNITVDGTLRTYYELDMSSIKAGYAQTAYDIEAIGSYAFYNSSANTGSFNGTEMRYVLRFGDKLKTINSYAFNNCNDIYAIYADNVTHCGSMAIANCGQLYRLVMPSLKSIGEMDSTLEIISNCQNLNYVETSVLNRNHTSTKCSYFSNKCPNISLFLIDPLTDGSSYATIAAPGISNGNSKVRIVVDDEYYSYYSGSKVSMMEAERDDLTFAPAPVQYDVFTIPKFVIYDKTLLVTSYTTCEADNVFDGLPADVHTIGQSAFQNMAITTATNPNSVLRMPDSVTQIESYAFYGSNKTYHILDLNNVINIKNHAFTYNVMIEVNGPKVERIGAYAFAYTKMYRLDLPEWRYVYAKPSGVDYPAYFRTCSNLKYANLGPLDNLGTEKTWAFWQCTSLTLVTIDGERRGEGSTKILELGWYGDTAKFLAIVSGENSVIAESGNSSAYEILIESLNDLAYVDFETTDISMSGMTDSINIPTVILTQNGEETYTYRKYNKSTISGNFVIPSTLHTTGETVEFLGEEVNVYDFDTGVPETQIGYINNIQSGAFSNVTFTNCKKVTISSQVKTIGSSIFTNCAAEEFDLANVEVIGDSAFSGAKMKKITAEHVKTISENSFYNCTNLTEIELPAFENSTGYRNGPFCGSALTTITLGPNTKNLGTYMFYNLKSLNTITIQSAVVPTANDPFYLEGGETDVKKITMIVRKQAGFLANDATNWCGVPKDNFEYYDNSVVINNILYYWNTIDGVSEAKITGAQLIEGWELVNTDTLVIPSELNFPASDALPRIERLLENLAERLGDDNITYDGYLVNLGMTETSTDQDIVSAFSADANADWANLKEYLLEVLTTATETEGDGEATEGEETEPSGDLVLSEDAAYALIAEVMTAMKETLDVAKDTALSVGNYKVVYINGDVIKNIATLFKFSELQLPYGLRTLDFGYDSVPSNLERFSITDAPGGETCYFTVDERGALYNGDGTMLLLYPVGNKEESYTVANTVKIIASSAFRNNAFLETVTFNGDVTLSSNAFDGCMNLVEVIFEDDQNAEVSRFIGYEIFYNCGNLKSIVVPSAQLDAYKQMIVYDRIVIESYLVGRQTAENNG
ncbi:MAG: hypothetical protein E7670_02380 [Ruminococcaceae bacterium]|nr:hypothetical protein [Oscillospiraceae bacterium]